ncbi:MAG: DUF4238 domain-containing protein [Candidatus Pacebacteria bacterium]|nr:DUF4238 domain-containing protein [Candidatus Paceibacterota bacterium]
MPSKKHHYLPQFYVKGFTNNQAHVFVLNKSTGKINKQGKNGTFHKYKFYTVDFNKHKQRSPESAERMRKQFGLEKVDTSGYIEYPDMIEDLLGDSETASAPIIRKLIERKNITERERFELSTFIALMYTRNPLFHKFVSEIEEQRVNQGIKKMFENEENIKDMYNKILEEDYENEIDVQKILDCVNEDRYKVKVPKELTVQMMLLGVTTIDKILYNKTWLILEAPLLTSFITSDQPVFMNHPIALEQGPFSVGVETQGVEVIFPISKELILIMRKTPIKDDILYKKINRLEVRNLNKLIFSHSQRYIIARDSDLIKNLMK